MAKRPIGPVPARVPGDEQARLRELEALEILDTPPEPSFDDLAYLAAYICGTKTALVSLVDEERQWFKARVNMKERETPRDVAFCAHAILDAKKPMVVEDATKDPRFAGNPLVTGRHGVRFYAGAPLLTPEGHALGTLCVLDPAPRKLSKEQLGALRALARQVVVLLELRALLAAVAGPPARARPVTRHAPVAGRPSVVDLALRVERIRAYMEQPSGPSMAVKGG